MRYPERNEGLRNPCRDTTRRKQAGTCRKALAGARARRRHETAYLKGAHS